MFLKAHAHNIQAYSMGIHDLNWYVDSSVTHHVTSNLVNLNVWHDHSSQVQIYMVHGKPLFVIPSGSFILHSSYHHLHLYHIV